MVSLAAVFFNIFLHTEDIQFVCGLKTKVESVSEFSMFTKTLRKYSSKEIK